MLSLRGKEIPIRRFNDQTLWLTLNKDFLPFQHKETITWRYESDEELVTLIFLVRHLQEHGCKRVRLFLPYLPNARMDRVKADNEVFTLKHFCWVINSLHFEQVTVFDPHSNAGIALLNKIKVIWPKKAIQMAFDKVGTDAIACFPDRGAQDRYAEMVLPPHICFEKKRNWENREIVHHAMISNDIPLQGKKVLIIDDICSSGGTILGVARTLKNEYGVDKVYAYVSHCENSVVNSALLKAPEFDGIFTTPSIYTQNHEKVFVLDIPW